MSRNYLWFRRGDAANAVLAVAGYNFRRRSGFCYAKSSSLSSLRFNPFQPGIGFFTDD